MRDIMTTEKIEEFITGIETELETTNVKELEGIIEDVLVMICAYRYDRKDKCGWWAEPYFYMHRDENFISIGYDGTSGTSVSVDVEHLVLNIDDYRGEGYDSISRYLRYDKPIDMVIQLLEEYGIFLRNYERVEPIDYGFGCYRPEETKEVEEVKEIVINYDYDNDDLPF